MVKIKLTYDEPKTKEILVSPNSKLKIKVIKGDAHLNLFRPHSITVDKIQPLNLAIKKDSYCFNENISEFHHFVIERNLVDAFIQYELL